MPDAAEIRTEVPAEYFASGQVRGSVVRPHIDWVRDHADRADVIEFFNDIPPAMRVVTAAAWYSFEDLIALDRVIVQRFGGGEQRCMHDVGRYGALLALGPQKRRLDRAAIHTYLHGSALRHYDDHDFGNAAYRPLDTREGQLIRSNWTSFTPLYCAMTAGFYREAVRMHGGVDVEVWESQCQCRGDETCTFEVMWS